MRTTTACKISQDFFIGVYGALVVLYMARDLGFAPGVLGTIWALGGISSLIGAVATGPTIRRIGVGPAMIAGCFLSGLAMFFVPLAQGATLIAALLLILQQLLGDGAATIYQINQVTLRQMVTPERLLGRVNASAEFLGLGAMLAGSLLGGLLGGIIGVRPETYDQNLGHEFDGHCLAFLHLEYSEVKDRVVAGGTDEEILEWCFTNGRRPGEGEIEIFNGFMQKAGWRDASSTRLAKLLRESNIGDSKPKCLTRFDFIEMDEGRTPPDFSRWELMA